MNELTEGEKMWISGCIDCDGSIGFSKSRTYLYASVTFYNNNKQIVDNMSKLLGSKTYKYKHNTKLKANQEFYYQTKVGSKKKVENLLKLLIPYLIVKKDKAIEVVQWLEKNPVQKAWGYVKHV